MTQVINGVTVPTLSISQFVQESCEHQNATTPMDFIGMARAYEWMHWRMYADPTRFANSPNGNLLYHSDLASLICLVRNTSWVDYRSFPAVFANGRIAKETPDEIHRLIKQLLQAQFVLSADEFYWNLMEIHPWDDGNGRVGALVWNYLNYTVLTPVHPPKHPDW